MAASKKKNGVSSKALTRRETIAGYAFMLPSLVFFLGFVIYPMFQCIITSFFDSTMNREDIFVGLSQLQGTVYGSCFPGRIKKYIYYCDCIRTCNLYLFPVGRLSAEQYDRPAVLPVPLRILSSGCYRFCSCYCCVEMDVQ